MALLIFFEVHNIHPSHTNGKDLSHMPFTTFSASAAFLDFDSDHRWLFKWISKVAARTKNKVFAQTCHLVRVLPHPCGLFWVPGSLVKSWSGLLQLSSAVVRIACVARGCTAACLWGNFSSAPKLTGWYQSSHLPS